ncbi:hypothetical protein Glove_271g56 [Diversispora epigaea]|uniref:Uncharacterized protein n=1 Tax=Diversispora epigaea TaxID=1348612 RepID=A0A397I491_9GLOM|nr:hypothetical protein Glove_271g56 [Diversispora epigaea]
MEQYRPFMSKIPWYQKYAEDYREFKEFLFLEHVLEFQFHLISKQSLNRLNSAELSLENKIFVDIEKCKTESNHPSPPPPPRPFKFEKNKTIKQSLLDIVKKKNREDLLFTIYFELYVSTQLLILYKSNPNELTDIDKWFTQRKICNKNLRKILSSKVKKNIIQFLEMESKKIYDLIKN